MEEITLLNYKGATTYITKAGTYQLVDEQPGLESTSNIFIDNESVRGDVYIYLPYSKTTYNNNNLSGAINVTLIGSADNKYVITPAKVEKPNTPDLINGFNSSVSIEKENGTIELSLYFENRWKALKF